ADSVDTVVAQQGERLVEATVVELRRAVDGSRRLFAVRADGPPLELDLDAVAERASLAAAAQLVGLAQQMLDITVEYAKQRKQFGQAIGSFQAVKHHLADVALGLEFARPVVHRAAVTMGPTHLSMATAYSSQASTLAAGPAR